LRTAGYPFADSISKSHIQAVGNMHSWPGIVAMLHWFVTSIKVRCFPFCSAATHAPTQARERALDGYSELRIDPSAPHEYAGSEEERPQAKLEYWIEYLATVYPAFLASDDFKFTHVPDAEATLQERFDASNEKSRARLQSLSEQNERLQAEVDRLRTTPVRLFAVGLAVLTHRASPSWRSSRRSAASARRTWRPSSNTSRVCRINRTGYKSRLRSSPGG
jgi:kinetochore protein NDC80